MKKIVSLSLGLCMTLSLGAGFTACKEEEFGEREFKNVILVIGDGMGENHILNAIEYFDLDVPVFMEDQAGYIGTNSLDGLTDSAASATALATGNKVNNSNLAYYDGEDLTQITTIAQKAKMKTGVITTDTLDGATPAAFSAHAPKRSATRQIITTQTQSNINLLMGRSSSNYLNRDYDFAEKGYTIAKTEEELLAAKDTNKLLGLMPQVDSEYIAGNEEDFQLKEMTQFAVEYLENDDGFFLMIEGAYIDKHSHNNNLEESLSEVRSLIDTVTFLYEYVADGETALFITADHETGGLIKANTKEEIGKGLYTTTEHTTTPVPLFVKNYLWKPENFGYKVGETPENTMIFEACKAIIKGK